LLVIFLFIINQSFYHLYAIDILSNKIINERFAPQSADQLWYELTKLDTKKRPKIALVLGGGGARGFTHIGVLEVFESENIPIDMIVGTSMGAIIGSLSAAGIKAKQIEEITAEIKMKDITKNLFLSAFSLLFRNKFIDSHNIELLVNKYIDNKKFYELDIPFACVAVDVVTGEKIIMKEGNVASAVRASSSIPGLFEPVEYKHRHLIDGGIVDNLPISVAKDLGADIIIAVNIESNYTINQPKTILQVLLQISYIQGERLKNIAENKADFILNPKVNNFSMWDINKKKDMICEGRIEARRNIEKIKEIIKKKTIEYNIKKNEKIK
jgi:NTE family protein